MSSLGLEGSVKTLRVGYPSAWGKLLPSLQNSVYADSILGNIFEPLTEIDPGGHTSPLAAECWSISDDLKTFTIKINTEKRFSNGKNLSSTDFKRSWEYGYSLASASGNHSLADVLESIVGSEDFERTKHFSGIETPDDQTLVIRFKRPFRTALDHLSGARYGAFVIDEKGRFLGTGRYVIREGQDERNAVLDSNPFHPNPPPYRRVEIKAYGSAGSDHPIVRGDIEVAAFVDDPEISAAKGRPWLESYGGISAAHAIIAVNGLQGRLFSKKEHRQALQYLVQQAVTKKLAISQPKKSANMSFDAQVYMDLQSGRIPESEVDQLVARGKAYVRSLVSASKAQPIKLTYCGELAGDRKYLVDHLKEQGLRIDEVSTDWSVLSKILYKTSDTDLAFATQSVFNGDPDGLYHSLGHDGAILFPMTKRAHVSDLLEEGRAIRKFEDVSPHYQKVTRAILEEVPVVHVGFKYYPMVYRNDRVKILNHKVQSRIREYFHLVAPRKA